MKKCCFYLLLLVIWGLSACQNTAPAAGQPAPVPATARRDPTPTPTSLLPRRPTPTSIVSTLVATLPYTHTSQRFSIAYPANWQLAERNNGVVFIEPGDRAGYSVFFSDVGQVYSAKELNQYLVTFVAQNFVSDKSEFTAISQEQKPDGTVQAQFATLDPKLGKMINEVRVSQTRAIVFVTLISATEEQWTISQSKLQALAGALTPLDTSPLPKATPTSLPPEWFLIGPTGNRFAFFYPSNWKIVRQEENTVVVSTADGDLTFEASLLAWPGAAADPKAAEKAALAYLTSLSKKYKDLQNMTPAQFPLASVTEGATVDFLYATESGVQMAGSVITAAQDEQMYRVVFTAPAKFYQSALQWFNPMYKSFKILKPEELVQ